MNPEIKFSEMKIPLCHNPKFYVTKNGETHDLPWTQQNSGEYVGCDSGLTVKMQYCDGGNYVKISTDIFVDTEDVPNVIGLNTGIDTYMEKYPEWNDKFFPTMLRCEKTHFWGYAMSPIGKCFAIFCPQPISSFRYDYNMDGGIFFGHRIYTLCLEVFNDGKLPERHPKLSLKKGVHLKRDFYVVPLKQPWEIYEKAWSICRIPLIEIEKTAIKPGEKINFSLNTEDVAAIKVFAPDGTEFDIQQATASVGVYRIVVTGSDGKATEACVSVLKPYEWYLKQARKEALAKPQKATTHAESWYGYYSAFLAAKHYPDPELDNILDRSFKEVTPYMFDIESCETILSPYRIQNIATLVGILVDRYEADKERNKDSLYQASAFGDKLMETQKEDGAYYRSGKTHYTCVIYIAKSMLELAEAEKELLPEKSKFHYESAGKAVENLVESLECIGTEGEHTLEDGMLTCSALQIGMYALTLPEEKRCRYIQAAEHMLKVHECLEQNIIPDSRMRGGTLRFWEAQYDVLIKGNMFNSPHGWTAWYVYAIYYLYLLTGKKDYLLRTVNALGSCLQLMSFEGKLRWAFITDPQITVDVWVPDIEKPIEDGYEYILVDTGVFSGQYEKRTFGEQYVDMISDWYRIGENKRAGGYLECPLVFEDRVEFADNQGGCCDNDVHEIFKCLEETLLKKAFVIEEEDGSFIGFECRVSVEGDTLIITSFEEISCLHVNINCTKDIVLNGVLLQKKVSGMKFLPCI